MFTPGDALHGTGWHAHVQTILRITRRTLRRNTATGLWTSRTETAFHLSSATGLSAAAWNAVIRRHWAIENSSHYVRDVTCQEDKSRIRANPGIMARARSIALNILRANHVTNVAQAFWNNALNLHNILSYKAI